MDDAKLLPHSIDTKRQIPHREALEAAHRLINSHFGNDNRARTSIPARPNYDDDLVLCAYIRQQATRPSTDTGVVERLRAIAGDDLPDNTRLYAGEEATIGDLRAVLASLSQAKGVAQPLASKGSTNE